MGCQISAEICDAISQLFTAHKETTLASNVFIPLLTNHPTGRVSQITDYAFSRYIDGNPSLLNTYYSYDDAAEHEKAMGRWSIANMRETRLLRYISVGISHVGNAESGLCKARQPFRFRLLFSSTRKVSFAICEIRTCAKAYKHTVQR